MKFAFDVKRLLRVCKSNLIGQFCLRMFVSLMMFIIGYSIRAQSSLVINGPGGSGAFGGSVTVLSNGNYVVTDPHYDLGGIPDVGAVYLYNGQNHSLISTLKGSHAYDNVGNGSIYTLNNGNFVVLSSYWNNNRGAVTWCNSNTGLSGTISSTNSLVGSNSGDNVGDGGIYQLTNGNYVVKSSSWDNGGIANVGAVTWCNGNTGLSGTVSSNNSLVGSTADDRIGGYWNITILNNGNYVVESHSWDNGGIVNAGAVTWCNGTTGTVGIINSSNSLVGSTPDESVGYPGIMPLSNGNYVVCSMYWDNGAIVQAGAVTWGNGNTGIVGTINSSNSLVGSTANDYVGWGNVGSGGITPLDNGNYLVGCKDWDNGGIVNAGAITWGNGSTGIVGTINSSNSLVGSTAYDNVGYWVFKLTNGNYVVNNREWDNGGIVNAGAVTWGNANTGVVGTINSSNSLIGSVTNDFQYAYVYALDNGNYVVGNPSWDNGGITDAGAATWANGNTGIVGVITSSNSLIGTSPNDQVSSRGAYSLTNGNYVVYSPYWDNAGIADVGAATWGNGNTGLSGTVNTSNSLVGTSTNDKVGFMSGASLKNGNYVVGSPYWNNGGIVGVGAATWCNGTTGTVGIVSTNNSLIGSNTNDKIAWGGIYALNNGNYVVGSMQWNNSRGAVTWANGTTGTMGVVSSSNSLVGTSTGDGIGNVNGWLEVTELANGNYIFASLYWDNGPIHDASAITLACADGSTIGQLNTNNSVLGLVDSIEQPFPFVYNSNHCYLIVGKSLENKIVIFTPPCSANPNAILSSPTPTICSGGAATVTLNSGTGTSNYTWQQSTNGGASWYSVSGTNTSTTSIVATLSATRLFRVIYSNFCTLDTTPVFTLNVVPDPTVTISASNNNFCAGTSGTALTATLNGGVGTGIYQWQYYNIQGGVSAWVNIAGATNATYTTPTLSANTNYKVISSQTGLGCVTTGANTMNIIVKPLPGIYTNPASPAICTGGSSSINAYNGTSYSWSPLTGLSATTGTPVVASPSATTTYSLTGVGSNGCSKTISVPVTVNLDPSVLITGDTTVCSGGSLTLTSVAGGGAGTCTRQWQSSVNGTTWSNIAGATGTTYTTPNLTATTYYRVSFTCSGSGCSPAAISASHKIHIFNNVLSSVGSTTVCVGGTVKLVAPVMGGTYQCSWTWQSSPNGSTWTTIPNANLTYYYAPTNTVGNTYYRANINCVGAACTNTPTPGMLVTVNPDPSVTITGQNSICGSGSTVLTANPLGGTGTSSYQWQENISGVFTNIAGATGLTYTSPVLTAAKTYRVSHAATGAGCGTANSANYSISILPLPSIYTSPASATFCIGGTSTITAYNGTSYSWSPSTGLSATTGSPVVASPTASTTYSLTGVGTNGCSKTIPVPVTVTADPSISILGPSTVPTGTSATLNSSTSGGSGTCTRQWQSSINGSTWTNVAGATGATYTTPAIVGTKYYRATYTCSASGCSPAGTSNVLSIMGIQPPVRMGEKVYDLSLYPNPASVGLTVSLLAAEDDKGVFIISDMLGKTLMQWEGMLEDGVYSSEVSIEGLSQGVYFLSVRIGERVMTEKFIKE